MSRKKLVGLTDGYWWAQHTDGTTFVVLLEEGRFWCCGLDQPMVNFTIRQLLMPVPRPEVLLPSRVRQ